MKRRLFLKTIGGAAGAAALGVPRVFGAAEAPPHTPTLARRTLGRTGMKVSVVGFPGLVLAKLDQDQSTAALHRAFDRGINFFDVAPAYGNGDAEIRMGSGLQGLDRSRYFLACKTKKRDQAGAQAELDRSLQRLKTDYFDLYQLHHLVRPAEVSDACGAEGAIEMALKAKQAGKIRFLGFSAHTTKGALAAMKAFKFDTVMFPINFVEYYLRDFGKEVLALAAEQGAGVIAIKPISWGRWPKDGKRTREWWYNSVEAPPQVELAMRFVLSQPGVATALPTSFLDLLDKTIAATGSFKPLDPAGEAELKEMAANRESLFLAEERQVALNLKHWTPVYPDSPHEADPALA